MRDFGCCKGPGYGLRQNNFQAVNAVFQTPEQGAVSAIYVATRDECDGISGEYFYKCKIHKASNRAKDETLAKQLWPVSEEIVDPYRRRCLIKYG